MAIVYAVLYNRGMVKFQLDKLVRDKLLDTYYSLGQTPTYKILKANEHKQMLVEKIIEEASEIKHASDADLLSEIADVEQALADLKLVCGIDQSQLDKIVHAKLGKRGGFENATYIETLELEDNDPWVKYYRKNPERFPEISN